jgi:hypothetical protein
MKLVSTSWNVQVIVNNEKEKTWDEVVVVRYTFVCRN